MARNNNGGLYLPTTDDSWYACATRYRISHEGQVMKEPFANPPEYRYAIPVNTGREEGDNGSVTVLLLTLKGWANKRRALMRNYLKKNYGLTRLQAEDSMRAMGFDDLYSCDE